MNEIRIGWVRGAVLTLLASAIAPFTDNVTPLVPFPVTTFVLFFFVGYGYLLFLPTIFVATFSLTFRRSWFGAYVLGVSTLLATLDGYWWFGKWADGLARQGRYFTVVVALENAIGFIAVLSLAVMGRRSKSKSLQAWAYVLLFMVLGWCAFPMLGDNSYQ